MSKEAWLKIGSVLIYLFVPPLVVRFLASFIEVLFLYQIDGYALVITSFIISPISAYMGIALIFINDQYILKQKK